MRASPIYKFAWAFYLVLALGGVLWLGLRLGRIPPELFVGGETWASETALGAVAGALLIGGWEAARRLSTAARELEARFADLLGPLSRGEALSLALISGVAEEIFFRGAVQGAWGWVPATVLFTLLHTGRGRPFHLWTAFAACAGLLLAGLMVWRASLLGPVVAHFVVNSFNLERVRARGAGADANRSGEKGRLE
jgi:membrane protease YdiL (CAAX protease family)